MGHKFDRSRGDRESTVTTGLWLTRRRVTIVEALAHGLVPKQIAMELGVSVPTVYEHIHAIGCLLHARTPAELVAKAVYHGFVDFSDPKWNRSASEPFVLFGSSSKLHLSG